MPKYRCHFSFCKVYPAWAARYNCSIAVRESHKGVLIASLPRKCFAFVDDSGDFFSRLNEAYHRCWRAVAKAAENIIPPTLSAAISLP